FTAFASLSSSAARAAVTSGTSLRACHVLTPASKIDRQSTTVARSPPLVANTRVSNVSTNHEHIITWSQRPLPLRQRQEVQEVLSASARSAPIACRFAEGRI